MCRNILVIGKGKPCHVTEAQAIEWVRDGKAIWQKVGRRIKYTAGKRSRPLVRDLSCCIDTDMIVALHDPGSDDHHLAQVFVDQTRRNHERRPVRVQKLGKWLGKRARKAA